MSTKFTFLNVGDGAMDESATRSMRAHVTKQNFARRRKRLVQAYQQSKSGQEQVDESESLETSQPVKNGTSMLVLASTNLLPIPRCMDSACISVSVTYILHQFRPLMFPQIINLQESNWIGLLVSEPALVEAAMALGLRHHPGLQNTENAINSKLHLSKALVMVNQGLDDKSRRLSDGMLAAVFLLSFDQKLARNHLGWKAHSDGLAHMIRLRKSRQDMPIPVWFRDLLSYDLVHDSLVAAEPRHSVLYCALQEGSDEVLSLLSFAREKAWDLRQSVEVYNTATQPTKQMKDVIDRRVLDVHSAVAPLLYGSPSVRSLGRAWNIFLHLTWPQIESGSLQVLAEDLRLSLVSTKYHLCACIDPTVWQLLVGAVAAEASHTRKWFIEILHGVLKPCRLLQWYQVLGVLLREATPDSRLMPYFKEVFDEILQFDTANGRHREEVVGLTESWQINRRKKVITFST